MRILIIDDSIEDRDLVITYIHKSNSISDITTDESNCLQEALQKIEKNDYDVILLDLILPETDGLDTIREVNKFLEKNNKNIPIIILTGLEDYQLGKEAFSLGIKEFIIKDEMEEKSLLRAIKFAIYGKQNQFSSKLIKESIAQ
jgi:CheY-like chemotaxis protein